MPQTQNAMSWRDAKVEISANGSTWTDASGFSNSLKVDGGERAVSEFFTENGDTPILTSGKRAALEVTMDAVYTEGAGEIYDILQTAYETPGAGLWVRWSPKGGTTGQYQFTTSKGVNTKPPYPTGAADSADAIVMEFTVKVATISKAVVA